MSSCRCRWPRSGRQTRPPRRPSRFLSEPAGHRKRTRGFAPSTMRPSVIPHRSETKSHAADENRTRRAESAFEIFPVENVLHLSGSAHTGPVAHRSCVAQAQSGFGRTAELERAARKGKEVAAVGEHIEDQIKASGNLLCGKQRERMAWLHEGSQEIRHR